MGLDLGTDRPSAAGDGQPDPADTADAGGMAGTAVRLDGGAVPNVATRSGSRPTRWTAVALGALAVATVALHLPAAVVIVVAAVGLGLVAVDLRVARRGRPRFARSELPTLPRMVAHPFRVEASIQGGRGERIRQPLPPELAVEPSEAAGTLLDGAIVGRHRGTHRVLPAVARVAGPLGLASCDHAGGGEMSVTVFPDLPRARRLAMARRRGRSTDQARVRSRLGLGTEFESIRDYTPDDDIRQVNWLATARMGRAMTNVYRVDENLDVVCLLDCGRLMASPVGQATRLDIALDALTVLAVAADDAGDRIGAVAFAGDVLRRLDPRRRGAEPVVRALFDLEPTEIESDYERAFQAVSGRKRALMVVFTDLVDAAAARTLLSVVPVVTRRHRIVIVSCRDPDLEEARRRTPADLGDVLRSAVSLDLLRARRRTVGHLRRMGADVVEADPDGLGPACVTAYLRVKSGGRP